MKKDHREDWSENFFYWKVNEQIDIFDILYPCFATNEFLDLSIKGKGEVKTQRLHVGYSGISDNSTPWPVNLTQSKVPGSSVPRAAPYRKIANFNKTTRGGPMRVRLLRLVANPKRSTCQPLCGRQHRSVDSGLFLLHLVPSQRNRLLDALSLIRSLPIISTFCTPYATDQRNIFVLWANSLWH